jgi:hypothetical protein
MLQALQQGQASQAGSSVVQTCPVISRLAATRGFQDILTGHSQTVHRALLSADGKACFRRWDMQHDDVLELREQLINDADRYAGLQSGSEWDEGAGD